MTDKEIIKALECCRDCCCKQCENEPDFQSALALINRQQAEIEHLRKVKYIFANVDYCADDLEKALKEKESLKAKVEILTNNIEAMAQSMPTMAKAERAEAVKEFAERLKEETYHHEEYKTMVLEDADEVIDNLVKEMVGEG